MIGRIVQLGLVVLVAVVLPMGDVRASEKSTQSDRSIVDYVHELVVLQDRLLAGEQSMIGHYRKVKISVGRRILASPDAAFKEPANIVAAIRYLLMGGIPHVGRKVLLAVKVEGEQRLLVEGATAFAAGRNNAARVRFTKLDALKVSPALAGNLALAQGVVQGKAKNNDAETIRYYNQALLLAPGTLIAESALRHLAGTPLVAQRMKRLKRVASRYLRRFEDSVFSRAFRRSFVSAIVDRPDLSEGDRAWLVQLLTSRKPAIRVRYALEIAREGLIAGKLDLVETAKSISSRSDIEDASERTRYDLYTTVASALDDFSPTHADEILALSGHKLALADRRILGASQALAKAIESRPQRPQSAGDAGQGAKLEPAKKSSPGGPDFPGSGTSRRARNLISAADKLMKSDRQ